MADIRVGVAGYGIRSRALLAACPAVPELQICAVTDVDEKNRSAAAAMYPGVKVFADYLDMLESGLVDAVLLETPPSTHADFAAAALDAGIHVMSDVPALHEIGEAKRLWDAAQGSSAVYSFGATTNFWAFVDTCADMRAKGLLGDPVYCEVDYVADLGDLVIATPWRKHYEPIRYCTHSLGPILKWIGKDLAAVSCMDSGSHTYGDPEDHEAMVAIFRTADNTIVKFLASFVNSHPAPYHRYSYFGTKGFFERTQPLAGGEPQMLFSTKELYGLHALTPISVRESRPELADAPGVGEHGGADYVMLRNFADCITQGAKPAAGVREALAMTLPGLYAADSARQGGALVEIHYPWE
jgi:predicted dehydrogenase